MAYPIISWRTLWLLSQYTSYLLGSVLGLRKVPLQCNLISGSTWKQLEPLSWVIFSFPMGLQVYPHAKSSWFWRFFDFRFPSLSLSLPLCPHSRQLPLFINITNWDERALIFWHPSINGAGSSSCRFEWPLKRHKKAEINALKAFK